VFYYDIDHETRHPGRRDSFALIGARMRSTIFVAVCTVAAVFLAYLVFDFWPHVAELRAEITDSLASVWGYATGLNFWLLYVLFSVSTTALFISNLLFFHEPKPWIWLSLFLMITSVVIFSAFPAIDTFGLLKSFAMALVSFSIVGAVFTSILLLVSAPFLACEDS